jgi:hypothetical protein
MSRERYGDYEVDTTEITNGTTLDSFWQAAPPAPGPYDGALVLGFGSTEREAVADYFRAWVARYGKMPPSVKDRATR